MCSSSWGAVGERPRESTDQVVIIMHTEAGTAFHRLQYGKVTESWVVPGNDANTHSVIQKQRLQKMLTNNAQIKEKPINPSFLIHGTKVYLYITTITRLVFIEIQIADLQTTV